MEKCQLFRVSVIRLPVRGITLDFLFVISGFCNIGFGVVWAQLFKISLLFLTGIRYIGVRCIGIILKTVQIFLLSDDMHDLGHSSFWYASHLCPLYYSSHRRKPNFSDVIRH